MRAVVVLLIAASGCYTPTHASDPPPPAPTAVAAARSCPQPAIGERQPWRHKVGSSATSTLLGQAHHAVTDPVINPGSDAVIDGKFAYGTTSKDLEGEDVTVWLQTRPCGPWVPVATARTDDDGKARFSVPAARVPSVGAYPFQAVVRGDLTRAYGTIFVVDHGTPAVVFDIDGTLTTSDLQLAAQIVLGDDPAMRDGADQVARAYARAGFLPIYVSGRPYFLREASRDWLRRHRFPRGVLVTTDTLGESSPSEDGVGAFKLQRLEELENGAGLDLRYAYGNASTDVCAYARAGIAPNATYIIGKHGGAHCGGYAPTVPLHGYPGHLRTLRNLSAAK